MKYKELTNADLILENCEFNIFGDWVSVKEHLNGLYIGRPVAEANLQCRIAVPVLPKSNSSRADNIRFRKPPHLR